MARCVLLAILFSLQSVDPVKEGSAEALLARGPLTPPAGRDTCLSN